MNDIARRLPMHDGAAIPQMGLGVMHVPEGTLPALMREAVRLGCRQHSIRSQRVDEDLQNCSSLPKRWPRL